MKGKVCPTLPLKNAPPHLLLLLGLRALSARWKRGFPGDLKSKPFSPRVRGMRTSSLLSSPTTTKTVWPILTEHLGRARHCASWHAHAQKCSVPGDRDHCPLCSWGSGHTEVQASDRWRSQDLNSGMRTGAPALFSTRVPASPSPNLDLPVILATETRSP